MGQTATQLTFEAPPRPAASGLRFFRAGLADPWRPALQHCAGPARRHHGGACPLALLVLTLEGLVLLIPNPTDGPAPIRAEGSAPSGASGSATPVTFKRSPQPAASCLPRRLPARLPPVYPERSRGASIVVGLIPTPAAWLGGPGRPLSGGRDALRGNENKPLRAGSNRNTNEGRKLAIHSESMTSKFLIATKLHVSEEKAKSDEKAKHNFTSGG